MPKVALVADRRTLGQPVRMGCPSHKRHTMKKLITTLLCGALLLSVANLGVAAAETEPLPEAPVEPQTEIAGRVEGTGTHFVVTDSQYLDITLDSSEPITLTLESVPEMVTMGIEPASGAASTQIALGGFAPETTYHKYEDDYHNHVAFTTDASGGYTYTQDLSKPHLVFIQPTPGTHFIDASLPGGGDCTSIGTWDSPPRPAP